MNTKIAKYHIEGQNSAHTVNNLDTDVEQTNNERKLEKRDRRTTTSTDR